MKWIHAISWGVMIAFLLPLVLGGREGVWEDSWAGWGTVRPFKQSPGLLFSIPLALGAAFALRKLFSWHS